MLLLGRVRSGALIQSTNSLVTLCLRRFEKLRSLLAKQALSSRKGEVKEVILDSSPIACCPTDDSW
jgi:hypothetical protein